MCLLSNPPPSCFAAALSTELAVHADPFLFLAWVAVGDLCVLSPTDQRAQTEFYNIINLQPHSIYTKRGW